MKRINLIKLFNPNLPKTNKEFERIKMEFLLNDIKYKDILCQGAKPNINLNDFEINFEIVSGSSKRIVTDELGFEEEFVELDYDIMLIDFEEEFERALDLQLNRNFLKFKVVLDEKGIYTPEKLEGFKKMKLKKINELIDFYKSESDLPDFFKDLIIEFYNQFYDYVSGFNLNEVQISDKIKFKLNRNQLILLFQKMLDKGVISGMSQLDLYKLLDERTMYTNNEGDYKDMISTRIQANKLQKGNTSSESALEKLSSIFGKDFFTSEA
jgi:hypothetical protein